MYGMETGKRYAGIYVYFLNKIEDTEEVRWTEKEKSEGHKTYKKLLELADGDSSDVIKNVSG